MTTSPPDLLAVTGGVLAGHHLPECRHDLVPVEECRWCHWALTAPQVGTLVDVHHDVVQLLAAADDAVPWVVAAVELIRAVDGIDLDSLVVPSVRERAERMRGALSGDVDRLSGRLRTAVAAGGPVEQRCLRTAGLLAAVALQRPEHAVHRAGLSPSVDRALDEVDRRLSADLQLTHLLPDLDRIHGIPLPRLRTQPEWTARPDPGQPARGGPTVEPGSLEALVVESVTAAVTDTLAEVATALVDVAATVTLARPADAVAYSGRTRSTMWRIARIDWPLTFVDTGRADCWAARVADGRLLVDVPWAVALAIESTEPLGLTSATRAGRPSVVEADARRGRARSSPPARSAGGDDQR